QLARRQRRRIPGRVVPLAAGDPLARAGALGVLADSPREFLRRSSVAKLHAGELEAAVDEVRVIVDEAGNGEPALQIDDRSILPNVGARSDRDNPISLDLYGLGPRPLPSACPDLSISENRERQYCQHSRDSIGVCSP